jgi:GNAT superfamily N-acetyltransferase
MIPVRPLCASDRDAWEPLWNGYLSFYGVDLAPGVTDRTWERLLDPAEDMHGIAAVTPDGAMVGIVHYLFHRVTWSVSDRCYLEDLFVAPRSRGLGAGRALIEAVYAAADRRGADQVYWLTEEGNAEARRLYDRVGTWTSFIKYRRP